VPIGNDWVILFCKKSDIKYLEIAPKNPPNPIKRIIFKTSPFYNKEVSITYLIFICYNQEKRGKVIRILYLFFILLAISLHAKEIYLDFKNNHYFNDKKLYDALGVKTPSWYQFYKDKRAKVDTKIVDSLHEILRNFYRSEGFYHVSIDKEDNNSSITFIIDENNPVIIKDIKSNLPKEYKKLIAQNKGDRFNASKFIESKKLIKQKLLKEGYCNANLYAKAYIDIVKNSAKLIYKLQYNGICHFNNINISTPKDIAKKVVFSRLNFHKGSKYSSKKVSDAYSSISGLEAFDQVAIREKKSNELVDLNIKVKKRAKTIRKEIGIGYETNLGPKALFRWEQRNFKGDARKISVDLKYSNKEKYIKNTLFWPAFTKAPFFNNYYLDFKNEFNYYEIEFDKFKEKKLANYTHLLKDYYNFSIDSGIGFERIYITKSGKICNISDGHFFLLYPFLNLIVDTRDSKINPKDGIYTSLYLESGLKYLGSDSSYFKLLSEARVIKSFNNFTVAIKTKFGFINEFQKRLPESKKFFAGGAYSNRAYGYNKLGATDSKCKYMGAKTIIDTSIESDYWVNNSFAIATFFDGTMINEKTLFFDTSFKSAVGIGIRYMTAIGPVKFDFGIDPKNRSQKALHFQIGQSF